LTQRSVEKARPERASNELGRANRVRMGRSTRGRVQSME
jgi:hypothetical protein